VLTGHIGNADCSVIADSDTWIKVLAKRQSLFVALLLRKIRVTGALTYLKAFKRCFPSGAWLLGSEKAKLFALRATCRLEHFHFEMLCSRFASGGQRDWIPLESPIVACLFYLTFQSVNALDSVVTSAFALPAASDSAFYSGHVR